MTYPTNAQIENAVPATGEPVRSLTQAVLKGLVGSLPRGTTRQVARFNLTSGELEAGVFTADMWSEFADGAPTTGVWLAAYIPESPEVMGFAKAETFPSSNSVPIRTSGEGPFTAGRLKASPATDPEDCVVLAQMEANTLNRVSTGPGTQDAPGEKGQFYTDADDFYICIAPNMWRVIPMSGFGV